MFRTSYHVISTVVEYLQLLLFPSSVSSLIFEITARHASRAQRFHLDKSNHWMTWQASLRLCSKPAGNPAPAQEAGRHFCLGMRGGEDIKNIQVATSDIKVDLINMKSDSHAKKVFDWLSAPDTSVI